MEIVYIIIGLVVGCIIGYLIAKNKSNEIVAARDVEKTKAEGLTLQLDDVRKQQSAQISEIKSQYDKQIESIKDQNVIQINELKEQHSMQIEQLKQQHINQIDQLKQQNSNQIEQLKQQHKIQQEQQMALLKEQINTTSEKILKERSEQLSQQNKEQLSAILNPLKEGITQMKEAVEKSGREHSETMVRLDATIKTSIQQSKEAGERADKLAQALTGENKTQGNFGELRLKQLLEDMGLEEGLQFEEQTTMKDSAGRTIYDEEEGKRMIPDVILHFPDERDVIIDSKMSFKAFEDYHNAETDEQRQDALMRHIASVRQHVMELSRKNYNAYIKEGRGKLDFVLMYVFSESALQLALTNAPTLWKEAYEKGVIITGSQNLYSLLRVLEMTWKQVRQIENQEEMMKTANMLVDRVQSFYERFLDVEKQLNKTQEAFTELKNISSPSGKSIEVAAKKLIKFGAQENPKRKYKLKKSDEELLLSDDSSENE